jgi:transcriptional regulator EpsA
MPFLSSLTIEELQNFHQAVTHSLDVRSHFDTLVWLQGDMQNYLPHEIMLGAWGNFDSGLVHYDIISLTTGVRTYSANPQTTTPLLQSLFKRWLEFGKQAFALVAGDDGFTLENTGLDCALGEALHQMRCALVHGAQDGRGNSHSLYIALSTKAAFSDAHRDAMGVMLPYLDTALRQLSYLPRSSLGESASSSFSVAKLTSEHDLSERETEILRWVAMGKTNPEIGSILNISAFTVKNHMQRIFKKLDVTNRAQAVSEFGEFA